MTIIVYPVGQGDLRNDIVGLSKSERQEAQGEAEQQVEKFLDDEDSEGLLKVLLEAPEEGSRFSAPPLSLILRALFPAEGERVVTVLLLASRSGDSGTRTWSVWRCVRPIFRRRQVLRNSPRGSAALWIPRTRLGTSRRSSSMRSLVPP